MTKNNDLLKEKLKQIPELPGIYKMLDSRRNIIYVGKSKCLKKRVNSYFVKSHKWHKINRLVSLIKDIDTIVTDTHLEARLLECELIKSYKPHFNAQMKNDRNYVYLKLEAYNPNNPLSVKDEREADSFGPFRRKFALGVFLDLLKNIYPITKTIDGYDFEYHLFPITMDKETFEANRSLLLELLTEEDNILQLTHTLQIKMEEAASVYRYEAASIYRDLINGFIYIKNGLNGYQNLTSRNILLKIPIPTGYKLFYIAKGQIIYNQSYSELSDNLIHDFIQHSKNLLTTFVPVPMDEKTKLDFRDILYSEISALPEDMIEFL